MHSQPKTDQRKHQRVPLNVEVHLWTAGQGPEHASDTYSLDLSPGGVQVPITDAHNTGTALQVRIALPGYPRAFELPAAIAWQHVFEIGGDKIYDTGIQFVGEELLDYEALSAMVAH